MKFVELFPSLDNSILLKRIQDYDKRPTAFLGLNAYINRVCVNFRKLHKGCEVYYKDEAQPVRVYYPDTRVIEIAKFKRAMPDFFNFISNAGLFKKILILIAAPYYYKYFINWAHWAMRDNFMTEDKYNQPAREMYRLIRDENIRDIVCAIIEYDIAYRLRFQDIVCMVNKKRFEENPIKETKRLFDILIQREWVDKKNTGMKAKWGKIKKWLWVLNFRPKIINELKRIVREMDLEAIAPTPSDWYWMCNPIYEGYNFGGLNAKQRLADYYDQKNNYLNQKNNQSMESVLG
jgi:hypothetical protein